MTIAARAADAIGTADLRSTTFTAGRRPARQISIRSTHASISAPKIASTVVTMSQYRPPPRASRSETPATGTSSVDPWTTTTCSVRPSPPP